MYPCIWLAYITFYSLKNTVSYYTLECLILIGQSWHSAAVWYFLIFAIIHSNIIYQSTYLSNSNPIYFHVSRITTLALLFQTNTTCISGPVSSWYCKSSCKWPQMTSALMLLLYCCSVCLIARPVVLYVVVDFKIT